MPSGSYTAGSSDNRRGESAAPRGAGPPGRQGHGQAGARAAPIRASLLLIVKTMERIVRSDRWLALVYHYLLGLNFFAGIQSGLRQYSGVYVPMPVPGRVASTPDAPSHCP